MVYKSGRTDINWGEQDPPSAQLVRNFSSLLPWWDKASERLADTRNKQVKVKTTLVFSVVFYPGRIRPVKDMLIPETNK